MSQEILQQLLNRSVAHIRRQGKSSITGDRGMCLYRSPDGCSCAAAPFINNYDPEMEENGWRGLVEGWSHALDRDAVEHAKFVEEVLQRSHDDAATRVESDSDFLKEYEREVENKVGDWNSLHGTSLTIPPVGWEVV